MKIIVTHTSPDLDAIASVWIIKKFLPDWEGAQVEFVQAGEKNSKLKTQNSKISEPVETADRDEYIHVDTGLGPLDHHQFDDETISAASLALTYVKSQNSNFNKESIKEKWKSKEKALERMVKIVVDIDHFRDVFWESPTADYHEFSLSEILDGLKLAKPNQDQYYVDFMTEALDALLHNFENRIWAEEEISKNGRQFSTKFGKGIGFESLNDSVLKLAQKMGYAVVVRRDPRKGYVRIKGVPSKDPKNKGVDLTLVYEKLKKVDPEATWFLHVSKKMLLNGSSKNPAMRPTSLSLGDIIKVLEGV